jgi:hypothetical protein
MLPASIVYSRTLPGGGYVAIDCIEDRPGAGHHARLWVERRADPARRTGHVPPVIAEVRVADADFAVTTLRDIAVDNVALAQAIRRWQSRNRGDVH